MLLMIVSCGQCFLQLYFSHCSFIYFEEVKLTVESVCDLLYCATKCMVTELADHCRRFIDKRLNSGNVCLFLDRVHIFYFFIKIRHQLVKLSFITRICRTSNFPNLDSLLPKVMVPTNLIC